MSRLHDTDFCVVLFIQIKGKCRRKVHVSTRGQLLSVGIVKKKTSRFTNEKRDS